MSIAAVIVAAGRGLRAGGALPKQWRDLAGQPVARRAVSAFVSHPRVAHAVLVVPPDDPEATGRAAGWGAEIVPGGATRAASVRAGLAALPGTVERVLIHDAARPLVSGAVIDRVIAALDRHQAAAPALPMVDALWTGADGRVTGLAGRDGLYRAQTPQGFHLAAVREAHERYEGEPLDDVAVALAAGMDVAIVEGDERNFKITAPEDFARALSYLEAEMDVRTGCGYDVHRFGPGDRVTLCGVAIPHERGLQGHSDADVGMHAIADAIYGALGDGDIGVHFPPSEPEWRGADSRIFLAHAAGRAAARGFRIGNVDCTLVCERPKIGPHAAEMREVLSSVLGIDADRIGVKATTSERLGFTGREEGIAALATATLVRP